VYFATPRDPIFRCRCGHVACGKESGIWTVRLNGDGTAGFTPSINWPEHFHDYYSAIPIVESIWKLHGVPRPRSPRRTAKSARSTGQVKNGRHRKG
jgi:hypothetical protein